MDELTNIANKSNEAVHTPVAPDFKPLVLVPEKARLLHTHDWGTQVFVAKCSDRKKITFYFYVVSSNGEVSEPIVKPLTKLTGKKGFDFLMDMEGDFDKADTDEIWKKFNTALSTIPIITVNTKTPMAEIYQVLCDKVTSIAQLVREDPESGGPYATRVLDAKDNCTYGNIPVEDFNSLVKSMIDEELWIGWTPLHIKQELRRLDKLRCAGTRYDFSVEKDRRAISIKLPEGWCLSDD